MEKEVIEWFLSYIHLSISKFTMATNPFISDIDLWYVQTE